MSNKTKLWDRHQKKCNYKYHELPYIDINHWKRVDIKEDLEEALEISEIIVFDSNITINLFPAEPVHHYFCNDRIVDLFMIDICSSLLHLKTDVLHQLMYNKIDLF